MAGRKSAGCPTAFENELEIWHLPGLPEKGRRAVCGDRMCGPEGRKGRDTMRMNLRTRLILVAGLVLCHLLLAGCGGGFTGNPSIFG